MNHQEAISQLAADEQRAKLVNKTSKGTQKEFIRDCKKWHLEILAASGTSVLKRAAIKLICPKFFCAFLIFSKCYKMKGHEMNTKYDIDEVHSNFSGYTEYKIKFKNFSNGNSFRFLLGDYFK